MELAGTVDFKFVRIRNVICQSTNVQGINLGTDIAYVLDHKEFDYQYHLAMIMDRLYGGVCYAGIDTDPELKYPKGAGRVAFSNQQSYIAAISARFVQLQHGEIDKRVEVKPYVLDDQLCDECQGTRCGGKFAPFFCANVTCLQYYCEYCWAAIHSRAGREFHKPLVKEGGDRPRHISFRWN
ncbi:Cytoplasmic polyadenylation element-binding protein 4 [Merluccius polli]|uniref:Cytoplasmic polyadenylation element-binding protein 4 n=1 Tax=Merluccius polli TaxID=89951 RepID=A0AA47M3G6_MERPO|nr:Cytoplasmic polyadenylation element-binding protein 4 [Merluccius polli]